MFERTIGNILGNPANMSKSHIAGSGSYGSYLTADARKRLLENSKNGIQYADAMIKSHIQRGSMGSGFDRDKYDAESRQRYVDEWNKYNNDRYYEDLGNNREYTVLLNKKNQGLATSQELKQLNRIQELARMWKKGFRLSDEEINLLRQYTGVKDVNGNLTTYTYS